MKKLILKYLFKFSDIRTKQLLKKSVIDFIDSEEIDNEDEYKYELNDTMEKELRLCISLLDLEAPAAEYFALRSLYYSKLNDSESALADAILAIQAEPSYADGYLRLADIFLHRKMYKTVMNVYTRALRNIGRKDENYQLIENLLYIEQYILTRPVDFVRLLPREIIEEIFSYLPFHMYIDFMTVSRTWHDFIINWKVMWRDLDFIENKIRLKITLKCLEHAPGRHVRRLTLGYRIINHHHNLKFLEFNVYERSIFLLENILQSVGKHLVEFNINDSTKNHSLYIHEVLQLCPELKKLSYKKTGNTIDNILKILDNTVEEPNAKVEELCIQIRQSSLIDNIHTGIFQCFSRLRVLDLEVKEMNLEPFYEALNTYCPHFESLSLSINSPVDDLSPIGAIGFPLRFFVVISSKPVGDCHSGPLLFSNQLEVLSTSGQTNIKNAYEPYTISCLRKRYLINLTGIKELDINRIEMACVQLKTKRAEDLLFTFPDNNLIRAIEVSNCQWITNFGLAEFIKSHGVLFQMVIIRGCKTNHKDTVT